MPKTRISYSLTLAKTNGITKYTQPSQKVDGCLCIFFIFPEDGAIMDYLTP